MTYKEMIKRIRQEVNKQLQYHIGCIEGSRDEKPINYFGYRNHYEAKIALFELGCFIDVLLNEPEKVVEMGDATPIPGLKLPTVPVLKEQPQGLDEAAEEYAYRGIKQEFHQAVKPLADEIIKHFKAGAEWMAGQLQKIEGDLVDWYSTIDGKDYCCGIKTEDAFEVPEGFYIKKK